MRTDRRIASMFATACLVLGLESGIAPASGNVLYDQTNNIASGDGVFSQDFETELDADDCQAADDFQVPSGSTWTITTITTLGGNLGGLAPPESFHVTFYANAGNLPGSRIAACDYASVTMFTGQFGTVVITLPGAGCVLSSGTYWVSVQASLRSDAGEWHWKERSELSLNLAVWRNPGGGFGACQNWTPPTVCGVGTGLDLAFRLDGTAATTGCTSDSQCQNGNVCDGAETCLAGSCQPGTPVPPTEVAGFGFCGTSKDCLQWTSDACASMHRVYVGSGTTLPSLLDAGADSCLVGEFSGTSTGQLALPTPSPGTVQWFLSTGKNQTGEGTAGNASASPRHLDTYSGCQSPLVINEVDYDQIGIDNREFVEIYNAGSLPQPLAGLALVFNNGSFNGGAEYLRVDLSAAGTMLLPGQYLVVADNAVVVDPAALVIRFRGVDNNVQNGAPDGLCLFDTASNTVIDALSYEGTITAATIAGAPGTYNLVEGTPTTAADSNGVEGSLSRNPNGQDSNNAQSDWAFTSTPTPGAANVP